MTLICIVLQSTSLGVLTNVPDLNAWKVGEELFCHTMLYKQESNVWKSGARNQNRIYGSQLAKHIEVGHGRHIYMLKDFEMCNGR